MRFEKYDISKTSYIKTMDAKSTQYSGFIREAERINAQCGGEVSEEEAECYYNASKVCEEIMNMNVSQRAVYNKWKMFKDFCDSNVKRISNILAPPPPPVPAEQPESPRKTTADRVVPNRNQQTESNTKSDFKTRNACKEVTAETIETWYVKKKPEVSFSDLTGMEELQERLIEEVANLGWDRVDKALGISPVGSFFFYGPPGTGKTTVIKAFARDLMDKGFKFIHLMGSDIHAPLVGVAEKTVQIAFKEAIDSAPCLLFIDEIENVCVNRDKRAEGHEKRLTVAFLEAYNMLKSSGKRIIFMGATNHPGLVDEAMLDRIKLVKIPLPNEEARAKYFKRVFGLLTLESGFCVEDMAAATDNYSYRDLDRVRDMILVQVKNAAIRDNCVTDEAGVIDQDASDIQACESILSGRAMLTRDLFEEVRKNCPPSDKTRIREELREFEENIRNLGN